MAEDSDGNRTRVQNPDIITEAEKPVLIDKSQEPTPTDALKGTAGERRNRLHVRIENERQRASSVDDTIATQLTNILLAGSVGAILASITFLKDIAPTPAHGSLAFLKGAWGVLLLAAAAALGSLITSRIAAKAYRDLLAAIEAEQEEVKIQAAATRCSRWNGSTKVANGLGIILLIVGTGLLLWFANLNLPSERQTNDRKLDSATVPPGVPSSGSTREEPGNARDSTARTATPTTPPAGPATKPPGSGRSHG